MNITFSNVEKEYSGGVKALRGLSFQLGRGVTGLLGPNGAGKSTLMNMLVGLLRPSRGRIEVDGQPLEKRRSELMRSLGYLPQRFTPYPALTAAEFLDYMAILKAIDSPRLRASRVREALESVHLADMAHRRTTMLSGGMRQRLGIAQALLNDPQVLVLDEPTAGLDPEERQHFRNLLAGIAVNRTVIVSSHIIGDLSATCERLFVLEQGRMLYDGRPEELRVLARGHVWEVSVPAEAYEGWRQERLVVTARKEGSHVLARIIARQQEQGVVENGQLAEPVLEDAYLWVRGEGTR